MKRWFLRVFALVTLVVLGLIAIAQAQRGVQPSSSEEPFPATAKATSQAIGTPGTNEIPRTLPEALPRPLIAEPRRPTPGATPSSADSPGTTITLAAAESRVAADIPPQATPPLSDEPEPAVAPQRVSQGTVPGVAVDPFARPTAQRLPARDNLEIADASALQRPVTPSAPDQGLPSLTAPAVAFRSNSSVIETAGTEPIQTEAASLESAGPGSAVTALRSGLRPTLGGQATRDSMAAGTLRPLQEPNGSESGTGPAAGSAYERPARLRGEPAPLSIDPTATPSRLAPGKSQRPEIAPPMAQQDSALLEGIGQPGKKQLEGPQSPQLTIQKFAPESIQVGKPATFRVAVVNTGQAMAHGVEIRDLVPRGTQLISTKPRASRGTGGELVWELGTLKAGDEISVEVQVMPVAEGEIGSVATVRFNADASARSVATKPELVLRATAPSQVLIGEELALSIEVSNPGTGTATGVVLSERVPTGLQHPVGGELEYKIGNLAPGESRSLQLALTATRAGSITNVLTASGEGSLKAEHRLDVHVIAPQLDVSMDGPKRRYLEREATYVVSVSNPGTAPARQVELVAHLPRGLKFVSTNGAGHYEPTTQTVHWLLEELPANDSGKVELVTLPIEAGEQRLRLQGRADKGLEVEKEQAIVIEGIAAIMFTVVDVDDPIERGGETIYEIRVVNQGSKASSNVRVVAALPAGMRAVAAEGPSRYNLEPNRVTFESLARLAPKADTTYRVRVQGLQPGDQRIRVQLLTDEMQEPVTKEESTRVYSDD